MKNVVKRARRGHQISLDLKGKFYLKESGLIKNSSMLSKSNHNKSKSIISMSKDKMHSLDKERKNKNENLPIFMKLKEKMCSMKPENRRRGNIGTGIDLGKSSNIRNGWSSHKTKNKKIENLRNKKKSSLHAYSMRNSFKKVPSTVLRINNQHIDLPSFK